MLDTIYENFYNYFKKYSFIKYILLFALITVLFLLFNLTNIKIVESTMLLCISLTTFYFVSNKKIRTKDIINFLIILGFIMRIGYMLYTPINVRDHDLEGHLRYVRSIYNGGLPTNNSLQNYHPPLFYFLTAMLGKTIGTLKYKGVLDDIFESAKIISCFSSCTILLITKRIAERLGLNKRGVLAAVLITAFLPNFYLLGGRANNDALSIMFIYITILYTIEWFYKPCYKYVIIIAFSIGLGMMTKISAGLTAFITGPVMLYVLFKNFRRDKRDLSILCQLLVFALICFPLALWYPIRNYILFEQPFNYVLRLSEELSLYCGDESIRARFFSLPLAEGFRSVYNNTWEDCNIWVFLLKCVLFGEFRFDINDFVPQALLFVNIIETAIIISAFIFTVLNKKVSLFMKYILIDLTLVLAISYISFNISFPFGCTMDFRYIVPMSLTGSIATGALYSSLIETEKDIGLILSRVVEIICLIFAVYSVIMYTTIN